MDHNDTDQAPATINDMPPLAKQPIDPPVKPAPKSRMPAKKSILIALTAIVTIAVLGGFVYAFTRPYPSDDPSSSATTTPEEHEHDDHQAMAAAEHTIGELETKVAGEKQQVDARTEQGGTGKADGIVYANAAYQAGGQQFAVYPTEGYGFGTWSTEEVAGSDIAAVESYLEGQGFAETPEDSGIFASDKVVCAITLFNQNIGGFNGMGVGCADKDAYGTNYQAALPFFAAYKASSPETIEGLTLFSPAVKDGAGGYKNARINISSAGEGFVAFFYQEPQESGWIYFMGTQNDLSCDIFDTAELKMAFNGQRCIIPGTSQESTVASE